MSERAGRREYYGLQVLRAAAALAVVAGHSTDYLREQTGSVPAVFSWIHGPAGVDVFFVISGFVMMLTSGSLLERPAPARTFLVRRLIRIVPLYWLLTFAKVPLVLAGTHLTNGGRPSAWNIVSSFLFIPSFNAAGEIRPLIAVAWTLSFEMFFYLVFAAGMRVGGRSLKFVSGAIGLIAGVGLVRASSWPAWTALADPIVLEFLAGVWLAKMTQRGRLPSGWFASLMVAIGLIGFEVVGPGANVWSRAATWGVCAFLLVTGVVALEGRIGARVPRWALLAGDASYSIYLGQSFVFPLLHTVMKRFGPHFVEDHAVEAGALMMSMSLVVVGCAGVLMYRLVERPMTLRLRDVAGQSRPRTMTP